MAVLPPVPSDGRQLTAREAEDYAAYAAEMPDLAEKSKLLARRATMEKVWFIIGTVAIVLAVIIGAFLMGVFVS